MRSNFYIRRAAMHMLANGDATLAEVATLADVSRQAVRQWAEREQINTTMLRRKRLRFLWRNAREAARNEGI